jgi:hypothetical protein
MRQTATGLVQVQIQHVRIADDQVSASLTVSAQKIVRDIVAMIRNLPTEWIKNATLPIQFALDLLYDIIASYKELFRRIEQFQILIRLHVVTCDTLLVRS